MTIRRGGGWFFVVVKKQMKMLNKKLVAETMVWVFQPEVEEVWSWERKKIKRRKHDFWGIIFLTVQTIEGPTAHPNLRSSSTNQRGDRKRRNTRHWVVAHRKMKRRSHAHRKWCRKWYKMEEIIIDNYEKKIINPPILVNWYVISWITNKCQLSVGGARGKWINQKALFEN